MPLVTDISNSRAEAQPGGNAESQSFWPSPRLCLTLLLLYFAATSASRSLIAPGVEVDEAEQLILTQEFAWGYGPQPPLYTWLQLVFFRLLGTSVFGLAALKSLVLAGTGLATYWAARRMAGSHGVGLLAAALLLFSPEIAWESQRDRTHNVLAAMFAVLTVLVLLRLKEKRSAANYTWLGACMALGLLAKYNYALFLASLLVAAGSLRSWRPILWHRGLGLAVGLAALVVLPHAWWAAEHPDLLFASAGKLNAVEAGSWARDLVRNIADMVSATLRLFGPALGVAVLLWAIDRRVPARPSPQPDSERLMWRQLLFAGLLVLAAAVAFHVTSLKARWFQPILVAVPVLLGVMLGRKIKPRTGRVLLGGAGVVALVLVLALPGRFWLRGLAGKSTRPCAPFRELAAQMQPLAPQTPLIIAPEHWIGGNLRLALPHHRVVVPYLPVNPVPAALCALTWSGESPPPAELLEFAESLGFAAQADQAPAYYSASYKFCPQARMTLGVMLLSAREPAGR